MNYSTFKFLDLKGDGRKLIVVVSSVVLEHTSGVSDGREDGDFVIVE